MSDTTWLITGATGGIGRALVARSGSPGRTLLLVARNGAALSELAALHPRTVTLATDLTRDAGAAQVAAALDGLPPLTGFAHLVGGLTLKPVHRLSLAEWRDQCATHLDSAFLVLRVAVQRLLGQGGTLSGVFCSSVAARVGLPNHEAVAAAKAGIEGLLRAAAASYAERGLRLNAIAPSLTETPLTAGFLTTPSARASLTAQHPLGRLGTPEDQAAAIAWLLSPESAWVTAQVLGVDGGFGSLRVKR